jgi:hypothetical protein
VQVRYQIGNEHSPTSQSGRFILDLDADGALRVEHRSWEGPVRAWTAWAAPQLRYRLGRALAAARFPAEPDLPMPVPGTRMRSLAVSGGPEGSVLVPEPAVEQPGWGALFALLDGLLAQLSGREVRGAAGPDPGVTGVREVTTEAG